MNSTELLDGPSFTERLAARVGELTRSERLVAQFVHHNPETAVVSSAAALGRLTETSDATVLRAVRALGYRSLPELQRALVAHLRRRSDLTTQLAARTEAIPPAALSVLDQVRTDSERLVHQLNAHVPPDQWRQCVELVDAAAHVLCFGTGPSAAVAQHLAVSLSRVGRHATAVHDTGVQLADALTEVRADWAIVVFAPLRLFREVPILLNHARGTGAHSIAITETLTRELRRHADVVLTTPPSVETTTSETLAALVLAHALTLEVARLHPAEAAQRTQLIERLRVSITGRGSR
ncbi:MurR/RpiR family transcriptional regulator [Marinitenerispora sediminis]|uniref:MurR/RpiR family transcriptional regulator n=1 Tax=Marinitenerispora sediminis TaxID=1931232 RepID=A0A368T9Q1_9ACTN|nr:MurR/RpiR family transcriptional regulator [Marinitenerispora sediminis]RCV58123.1 MurR/RpiR family transcriptional regulator [Marinitenerispora sediminis]RCV58745.1 MurR/RpiR family transcriptional regulator [Marinitenerispora sediminis]RCV61396.1 MurR/RpiR family transcriptional regulator [Marinitenerispora sediminis]